MIKGNIILATTSGSEMQVVDTINETSKCIRFQGMDLYVTTVTEDTTLIGRDSIVVKAKAGWHIFKCNCHRFYYACSPKSTIQDLLNAWAENEKVQAEKQTKDKSCAGCINEDRAEVCCESQPPSNF